VEITGVVHASRKSHSWGSIPRHIVSQMGKGEKRMSITIVVGFPSRSLNDNCRVETFYNNPNGAIARYGEMIAGGKYVFVYIAEALASYPSGID